jgi:DNA-binding protein YbaB
MSQRRGDEFVNQRVPARRDRPATSSLPDSGVPPEPSLAPGDGSGGDRFEQVAAGMRRAAAVSARHYQVRSDDGTVAVTLDGRPRVRSVRIAGQAIRSGPGQLAARVAATVNRALQAARRDGHEALLAAGSSLESWVRAATEVGPGPDPGHPGVAELQRRSVPQRAAAAQVLTGTSSGARVSVTVNGLGEVTGIGFAALALRGSDLARLGNHVAEAVNAALEKAERYQRARYRPGADPQAAGDVIVEMFSYRMNGLLGRLDEMSRNLDRSDVARELGRLITELRDLADGPPADHAGD